MLLKDFSKLNCIDTYNYLEQAVKRKQPLSLIRLGDGEGALMGYPDITNRTAIDRSFKIWFGHTAINNDEAASLAMQVRKAVKNADIVGIPRERQLERHPYYKAVLEAINFYGLHQDATIFTDAAVHRYFQFCLFFRKLLFKKDYLGIVTPRAIDTQLKKAFSVEYVEHFPIKGEARFAGEFGLPHYPDTFEYLKSAINPPYIGALYLVGAGALGKIYCDVIKQKGGIAIDAGAIFDAWAGVKSRLVHPSHNLECYKEFPLISAEKAFERFNTLCDHFNIDTERLNFEDYPTLKNVSW